MSTGNSMLNNMKNIPLNILLNNTLEYCIKELESVLTDNYYISSRRRLMHAMLKSQIILARYIVVLRWVKKNNIGRGGKKNKNALIDGSKLFLETYNAIRSFQKKNVMVENDFSSIFQKSLFEIPEIKVPFNNILLRMLQSRIPSSISSISFHGTKVFVNSSFYSFCFKIKESGSISLINFSVEFQCRPNFVSKMAKMLNNKFKTLDKFDDFFSHIHNIFLSFRDSSSLLKYVELMINYEKKLGFTVRNAGGNKIELCFGKSKNCRFNIFAANNNVYIFSSQPINGKFFSRVITDENIKEVLSEAREIIVDIKLHEIQKKITNSLIIAGIPSFSCNIRKGGIDLNMFGASFAFIYISCIDTSVRAKMSDFSGISEKDFVDFLEKYEDYERVSFAFELYLTHLTNEIISSASLNMQYSVNKSPLLNQRNLRFSFAPDYSVCILNTMHNPCVSITDLEGNVIQANQIIFMPSNDSHTLYERINNTVASVKVSLVILQLQNICMKKNIECSLVGKTLSIMFSDTIYALFTINNDEFWKLVILRHQKTQSNYPDTICIHGHSISADFCHSLLSILLFINRQINIFDGVVYVNNSNQLVGSVLTENIFDFEFSLFHKSIPSMCFKLRSLEILQNSQKYQVFDFKKNAIAPKISLDYSIDTPFKSLSIKEANKATLAEIKYHKQIISMSKYMSYLYTLFAHSIRWSIGDTTGSISHIIFVKIYTINITNAPVKGSGMHAAIIPLSEAYEKMQVPMSICGTGKRVGRYFIEYSLSAESILNMKTAIEEFFCGFEILKLCGFTEYSIDMNTSTGEVFMKFKPHEVGKLRANVQLTAKDFLVEYSGLHMKKINALKDLSTPKHNRKIFCLIFGSQVISPLMNAAILDGIPKLYKSIPGIDWDKTFNKITMTNRYSIQMGLYYGERGILIEYCMANGAFNIKTIENGNKRNVFSSFNEFISYLRNS